MNRASNKLEIIKIQIMISLLADALASQTLSFNHYLSGMIHLPLLFPSCPTSSSSYVCYFLFIIHFHTIHNSCFGICVQLRVRGGFHAAFRLAHATLCIMCPRLSGMMSQRRKCGGNRRRVGSGVRSGWWVCWLSGRICRAVAYMERQDILEEEETVGKEAEKQD